MSKALHLRIYDDCSKQHLSLNEGNVLCVCFLYTVKCTFKLLFQNRCVPVRHYLQWFPAKSWNITSLFAHTCSHRCDMYPTRKYVQLGPLQTCADLKNVQRWDQFCFHQVFFLKVCPVCWKCWWKFRSVTRQTYKE